MNEKNLAQPLVLSPKASLIIRSIANQTKANVHDAAECLLLPLWFLLANSGCFSLHELRVMSEVCAAEASERKTNA